MTPTLHLSNILIITNLLEFELLWIESYYVNENLAKYLNE